MRERVKKVITHANAYIANCTNTSQEKIDEVHAKFLDMYKGDKYAIEVFDAVREYLSEQENIREMEKDILFSSLEFFNSSMDLLDQGITENVWTTVMQNANELKRTKSSELILETIKKRTKRLDELMKNILMAEISYLGKYGEEVMNNAKCS